MGSTDVVVKISGKLLSMPNPRYLAKLKNSIIEVEDRGYRLIIVVGGGAIAREYINVARALGVRESLLDIIGIEGSRMNAVLLAALLYPKSSIQIPRSIEEVLDKYSRGLIPVVGGFQPGQSTNAVACAIADAIGAGLIVNMLSDIDGVYSATPGDESAVKLDRLSYDDMEKLIYKYSQSAGGYSLFDKVALGIIRRAKIPVVFIDGRDPSLLLKAVEDPGSVGSLMTA
ncbi:MAG: UMP kinase [Desulfurococcales archaeon]|nr:UMP kinase [Desulfurococcales archaeon]